MTSDPIGSSADDRKPTDIERLEAEIAELRADWEAFRVKMAREFIALVDEYRGIDEIRRTAQR